MGLRPFKYVARAVFLEEDGSEILSEVTTEEVHLYSERQVLEWLKTVDDFAAQANNKTKPDTE